MPNARQAAKNSGARTIMQKKVTTAAMKNLVMVHLQDRPARFSEQPKPDIADICAERVWSALFEFAQLLSERLQGFGFGLRLEGLDFHRSAGLNQLLVGAGLGEAHVRRDLI